MNEVIATAVPGLASRNSVLIAGIGDPRNFNASGAGVRSTSGDIGPTAL